MEVGTKTVYPFSAPQQTQEFIVADWSGWKAGYALQDLIRFGSLPGDGYYRMFRLRCVHSDDLPLDSKVCIELIFGKNAANPGLTPEKPEPFPPFTSPSILLEPTYGASLPNPQVMKSSVSSWLTIGNGTAADLSPYLDAAPIPFMGLHGLPSQEKCRLYLYSVVMECWDFTDPLGRIATSLPNRLFSYAGTRMLTSVPGPGEWWINKKNTPTLYSRQREGAVSDGKSPGSRNGYQLRGNFSSKDTPPERVLIQMTLTSSSDQSTWVFDDFKTLAGDHHQIKTSISAIWFPPSQTWPVLNGDCLVTIEHSSLECDLYVYWLVLDACEYPSESPDALPVIPRTLVFERPLSVVANSSISPGIMGSFQDLFAQAVPRLPLGTGREFFLRFSVRSKEGSHFGTDDEMVFKLVDVSGKLDPIVLPFQHVPSQDPDNPERQFYFRSAPITFGDAREPSISQSEWTVEIQSCTSPQKYSGLIECVLEAVDEVFNPEHAVTGHTFALALSREPYPLPKSPNLEFHTSSLTISLWFTCFRLTQEDKEDEPSKHVILTCGSSIEMGFTQDGSLYASLLLDSGLTVFAQWDDQNLDQVEMWYHIAFTWDGSVIQLAVDGLPQDETFPALGSLYETGGEVTLGSNSFVGAIRSVALWSKALSTAELRSLPHRIPSAAEPQLLAHLEFRGRKLLVNSPGVPEWRGYEIPGSTKLVWETSALTMTPPAIASFSCDEQLHITAGNSYTLEAWIAPTAAPNNQGVQFIAGKQTERGVGYSIALVGSQDAGTRVVGFRGGESVVSEHELRVTVEGVWRHVAVLFTATADPPTMAIFIDGVLSGITNCKPLPPSQDIDIPTTDFTVGGYGDYLNSLESFCGYIGTVRLWRVARSAADIRDWMYVSAASHSPALAAEYNFTSLYTSSGGDNDMPTFLHNVAILNQFREISAVDLVSRSQRLMTSTLSPPPNGQDHSHLQTSDAVILRRHTHLLELADDDSTIIWIDFMVTISSVLFNALGFDVGDPTSLRNVCHTIWISVDAIRSHVINMSTLKEEVMEAILAGGLEGVDFSQVDWRAAENLRGSDVTSSSEAVTLCVNLLWTLVKTGQMRNLIQSLGRVSWFSIIKFEAKFIPYVGQIYLAVRILIALKDLFFAVTKLKDRIKENEKKNTKPGLRVTWAGGACSSTSQIPLQAGASHQELQVELNPPSLSGSVTVSVAPSYAGLTVIGAPLVFAEGEAGPRVVKVKAAYAAVLPETASLAFQMQSQTTGGGINVGLDVRKQDLIMTPEATLLDLDKDGDTATLTLSMAAIIDADTPVEVCMQDVTKDIDQEPYVLEFKPARLTFTRGSSTSHQVKEQVVEVTLKWKSKEEQEALRGEVATDSNTGKRAHIGQGSFPDAVSKHTRSSTFNIQATHRTRITMVAAGKGDCYVISDRLGDANAWRHLLIDGGMPPTLGRLQNALDHLEVDTLDAVCATHYDRDHIAGLLALVNLAPTSIPTISQVWFNDPNIQTRINTIIGDNLQTDAELVESSLSLDNSDDVSSSQDTIAFEEGGLASVAEGQQFINRVINLHLSTASPRGRGPARADFAIDHAPNVLPNLRLRFTGPTGTNVQRMRNDSDNSENSNRSSTIFVIRDKPLDPASVAAPMFNALFTGDAWDTNLHNCLDIRAALVPGQVPQVGTDQHFKVMKVPHHGSNHSTDQTFYHSYTASYYLISTSYNSHKHPTLSSLRAMLHGCYMNNKAPPIIICSSWYTKSKINTKLLPALIDLLNEPEHSGTMYIFDDGMEYVTLEFKNGVLQNGWDHKMWKVDENGAEQVP